MLLFHGFSDHPGTLEYLGRTIAEQCHADVFIPLLPGHGDSLEAFERSDYREWYDLARSRARALAAEYKTLHIIGFSMGTLLAEAASLTVSSGKTVFIAPPWYFTGKRRFMLNMIDILRIFRRYKHKRLDKDGLNAGIRDPQARKDNPPWFKKEPLRAIREYERLRKKVTRDRQRHKREVFIQLGAYDRVAGLINQVKIQRRYSNNIRSTVIYNSSGHMLPVDHDREEVCSDIIRFIKG